MKTSRFIFGEALEEFRASCRSGVFPVAFVGLMAYVLIVLTNAEYLREMGAVGIARNAPNLVYMMTAGQMFWLMFVWAWMFARVITRDRDANLHEYVLSAPIPLRAMLVGRWLGGSIAAWLLGLSTSVAFVIAPLLEAAGVAPAGSFGSAPWAQLLHGQLVLVAPMAFGLGALFVAAAIRTRSSAGPFGVAAILIAMWMFSMVFVKSGGMDPLAMAIIDPSGYAAVEFQTDLWTPAQKASGFLAMTPEIVISRILWLAIPMLIGGVALWRVRREGLVFSKSEHDKAKHTGRGDDAPATVPGREGSSWAGGPIGAPSWGRALYGEVAWHVTRTARSRGVLLATGLLGLMCVAGSFVHVVGHVEGPMVPRPYIEAEMLSEFSYMIVAFIVTGVIGAIARSDDHVGFGELFDVLPTPEWVRTAGRVLASAIITLAIGMIPSLSAIIVTALSAPATLDVGFTLSFFLIHNGPGLLELCALMILAHAVVRPAGPAYAVSVLLVFICVINHEVGLINYPPAQLGLPMDLVFSELSGVAASAPQIAWATAHKLAVFGALVALAAFAAPRGVEHGLRATWSKLPTRVLGPAGVTLAVCVAGLVMTSSVFHTQYVERGGYMNPVDELGAQAAWEREWLEQTESVTVAGGSLDITATPGGLIEGTWAMDGVRGEALHAQLPLGFSLTSAKVAGAEVEARIVEDHLRVPLTGCASAPCIVKLKWSVATDGWDTTGAPSWNRPNAVWFDLERVAPTIGFDPSRIVRGTLTRAQHGLPERAPRIARGALVPSRGIAPVGRWSWRVELLGAGRVIEGSTPAGHMAAVVDWLPECASSRHGERTVCVAPGYASAVEDVVQDVADMEAALGKRIEGLEPIRRIVGLPRGAGEIVRVGDVLWLPEDEGLDVTPGGLGHTMRRVHIAQAIASAEIVESARLDASAASSWLEHGVGGALGFLAVAHADGDEALKGALGRAGEKVTLAMSSSENPIEELGASHTEEWAHAYAAHAALSWVAEQTPASLAAALEQARAQGADTVVAAHDLGAPRSSDVSVAPDGAVAGLRQVWKDGGWQEAGEAVPWRPTKDRLMLDKWPSLERTPEDNMVE